jgi:hypothetical protein
MLPEEAQEKLLQAVQGILEEAAFVFTETVPEPGPPADELLQATLTFSGPARGRLVLTAPPRLGVVFAANLLGVEPDDPAAGKLAGSAFGEMLNMIAGALMELWFGRQAICRLGVPEVRQVSRADDGGPVACSACLVTEEQERVDVQAYLEEAA